MSGLGGHFRSAATFVDDHRARLLAELQEFLRYPTVSAQLEHSADLVRGAEFLAARLQESGMENVRVIATRRHPLVYADWLHAPGRPTVLCYGHYDVQPPEPVELWTTPPFEPDVRGGRVFARGASDDKGQLYTHIKAVEALRNLSGALPVNVRFLIEGEEEVGSESIHDYVQTHIADLRADVALISDLPMFAEDLPTLHTGLRGIVYMEWEATGPARDLHSGLYGGVAPNPVFGLAELLAAAKDTHERITIPGIYDDVRNPDPIELESWARLPLDEERFRKQEVGSPGLTGEPGFSLVERMWSRPTFDVHGIAGGFTGRGSKTVIPACATAKVSMRLAPDQSVEKVVEQVRRFLDKNAPNGIHVSMRVLNSAPATLVNPGSPAIRAAAAALAEVFGGRTAFVRSGGTIPVVGYFQEFLALDTVLMGFGLPDDNLHAPDENFLLANYYRGIAAVARFLEMLPNA
jgi:acetylornithine deacetylase/succinyl-diaminopimelate desuccinylase-like protein